MNPPILRNDPGKPVHIETAAGPWYYGGVTTNADALPAISAKVDILTTPPSSSVAAGRIVFPRPSGSLVQVRFWGTDAANETAKYRIWRWSELRQINDTGLVQWHAELVALGVVTLGAQVGVSGGILTNLNFYADAITDTSTRSDTGYATNALRSVASTPDDNSGSLRFDPEGDVFFEVEMSLNGETAASVGFNYRGLTSS